MKKLVSVFVALSMLSACATPTYAPPAVTQAEVDAAASRAKNYSLLKKYPRTPAEQFALVAGVEERIRPAAMKLCPEIADGECRFRLNVESDETPNAYVDGDGNVFITTGLLDHLETEDEVAFIVGHEFAHKMADHHGEDVQNTMIGAGIGMVLMGALAAAAGGGYYTPDYSSMISSGAQIGAGLGHLSYSKAQEREADYLGAYMAAEAGYDVAAGRMVMDKLAAISGNYGNHSFLSTHPSSPERAASVDKIVVEIEQKRASGQALLPSLHATEAEAAPVTDPVDPYAGR